MPATANPAPATVAEAEATLAALHDRLLNGDPGVTQAAYTEAQSAVDFARAREEAAQRAAVRQAAEERREAVATATARLAALDNSAHDAARDQLRTALDALALAVLDRSVELAEIGRTAATAYGPGGSVTLGGVTRGQLPYQSLIRDIVTAAVREHFGPRQRVDLNNPTD